MSSRKDDFELALLDDLSWYCTPWYTRSKHNYLCK